MLNEFKTFIVRGNMIDLAVGLVIGAAFTTVVTSFVNDILMPPIGLLLGKVDFANLFVTLGSGSFPTLAAAKAAGVPTLNYGLFINSIIAFLIVAFAVFLIVRAANRLQPKEAAAAPSTKDCPYCKMPIPLAATRCPQCTSDLKAA